MKIQRQKLHLKLRGKMLSVCRVNKNGDRGKPYEWEIRSTGKLPRTLFYQLRSYVEAEVKACDGKNKLETRRAVRRGLRQVAKSWECRARRGRAGGDLTFYLNGQPLITFVVTSVRNRRSEQLLLSEAVFRWIVQVRDNKFFEFVPLKPNSKWCE